MSLTKRLVITGIIVSAITAIIVAFITGQYTWRAATDAASIPIRATQTAQAQQLLASPASPPTLPPLANVLQQFRFEDPLDSTISLGVCERYPDPWSSNCHDAPERLVWSTNSFSGAHSLGVRMELLPDKEQVYSLRLPLKNNSLVQGISANVYIPQTISQIQQQIWISVICKVGGIDRWALTKMEVGLKAGWMQLFADLRQAAVDGKPVTDIGIEYVHIDFYLPRASTGNAETIDVMVDDVLLFSQLSDVATIR